LLREPDVLFGRHAWAPPRPPSPAALERATRALEGAHDCTSFESAGSPASDRVCRILRARWTPWDGGLRLDIVADHFLYHMVRTVVGTALALAGEPDPAAAMRAVLAARDRAAAGPVAPACGLCLEQVFYPEGDAA
jgi:tRNA pseudouridine38-40 synthase